MYRVGVSKKLAGHLLCVSRFAKKISKTPLNAQTPAMYHSPEMPNQRQGAPIWTSSIGLPGVNKGASMAVVAKIAPTTSNATPSPRRVIDGCALAAFELVFRAMLFLAVSKDSDI